MKTAIRTCLLGRPRTWDDNVRMSLRKTGKVDRTGSGSYPVASFCVDSFEPSGSVVTVFVCSSNSLCLQPW